MSQACCQTKQWKDNGAGIINISAAEFSQTDLGSQLEAIINETGLPAVRLCIELTENMLMRHPGANMNKLATLKNLGVQLAINDFGTGYSNLKFLRQLPIDVLKIDPSFVHEINEAAADGVIVSAAIAIGSSLQRLVVAEDIENQAQLDFLKEKNARRDKDFISASPWLLKASKFFYEKNLMKIASPCVKRN